MPQTTLPQPGKNFRIARAPSRRSILRQICPDGRHKFRRSAQLRSRPLIYMMPRPSSLGARENRQVCQRNGLRSDCRANGSRRFYQHLCDVMLRFAITRNQSSRPLPDSEAALSELTTDARFGRMHSRELNDLQQTVAIAGSELSASSSCAALLFPKQTPMTLASSIHRRTDVPDATGSQRI